MAGGKSRKSGGVSKALIEKIKRGDYSKKSCGTKKKKGSELELVPEKTK
jgi:hypothetical protein